MKDFIFSDVKNQLLNHLNDKKSTLMGEQWHKLPVKALELNNGVTLSVQASKTHYCYPKIDYGIWDSVEAYLSKGTVSQELLKYQEEGQDFPVIGFVPIDLIVAEIIVSGGIKDEEEKDTLIYGSGGHWSEKDSIDWTKKDFEDERKFYEEEENSNENN